MRFIPFIILLFPICIKGQYSVNLNVPSYNSDLNVKVGNGILFADIMVEIAENILYEDFSIGFTDTKSKADVIIINNSFRSPDLSIQISNSSFADITVDVSGNKLYEDVSIEIRNSGLVDFLVYSEDNNLTREKLVVALLPIINSFLKYKFKQLPFWVKNGKLVKP